MRRISLFIDKEQITHNTEFDTLEYNEELDEFHIILDSQQGIVKIQLGPGTLTIDKQQFEEQIAQYKKQCIEETAEHHFKKLQELVEAKNLEERSIAKASLRVLCKNYMKKKGRG